MCHRETSFTTTEPEGGWSSMPRRKSKDGFVIPQYLQLELSKPISRFAVTPTCHWLEFTAATASGTRGKLSYNCHVTVRTCFNQRHALINNVPTVQIRELRSVLNSWLSRGGIKKAYSTVLPNYYLGYGFALAYGVSTRMYFNMTILI